MKKLKISAHVAIVGGGIGGLVMALQCHRHGIACMVFEAVEKLDPLGVGINLLPHSVKILSSLGLLDDLKALGIETAELAYFNKHGQAIWREPRGIAGGYDYPQISIHRGELHFMLLQKAIERLGTEHVLTGHAIKSFDANGPKARAVFENRRSGEAVAEVEADLLLPPTAFIPPCAPPCIPGKGRRAIPAACCGAAPACGRRSSPVAR